jgi:hypothetical protein
MSCWIIRKISSWRNINFKPKKWQEVGELEKSKAKFPLIFIGFRFFFSNSLEQNKKLI